MTAAETTLRYYLFNRAALRDLVLAVEAEYTDSFCQERRQKCRDIIDLLTAGTEALQGMDYDPIFSRKEEICSS